MKFGKQPIIGTIYFFVRMIYKPSKYPVSQLKIYSYFRHSLEIWDEKGDEADIESKNKHSDFFLSFLLLFGSEVRSRDGSVTALCFSTYRDSEILQTSVVIYYLYKLDLQSAEIRKCTDIKKKKKPKPISRSICTFTQAKCRI